MGKTRLVDELRALALVRGVAVVRGQVVHDGGVALQEWIEVLRPLCLSTTLNSLEAGVLLKTLIADLPELLGREVPDAPPLDAQAAQQRLIRTIADILIRQDVPTLLLLEDAHWSMAESLALLRRVSAEVAERPLLILVSYRNDECADLPGKNPRKRGAAIGRLSSQHVEDLCASMLGDAARSPALVELLERESEGNTYFLIEGVRVLAEHAGSLDAIGQGTLPSSLFSGGMQAILRRRIERVPSRFRELLKVTAVAGRQINLAVAAQLEPQWESFLSDCATAAVLELHEEQWRFSHDNDRRAAGVPAAEPAEEHVFLAPHDALGPAGGAAGVEHVAVVGGAGPEIARSNRRHERSYSSEPATTTSCNAGERTASTWPSCRRRGTARRGRRRRTGSASSSAT